MFDKVQTLKPISRDKDTIQIQMQQLEPLKKEYDSARCDVEEVKDLGNKLDYVCQSLSTPLRNTMCRSSLSVDPMEWTNVSGKPLSFAAKRYSSFDEDSTASEKVVNGVVDRYNSLGSQLGVRYEELDAFLNMSKLQGDQLNSLQEQIDWVVAVETTLDNHEPISMDYQTLQVQLENMKGIQRDLINNKPLSDEVLKEAETLLRQKKDRLTSDQQDVLQTGVYDLRSHVDQANLKTQDWLRSMEDQLNLLSDVKDKGSKMKDLKEWIVSVESRLGEELPMKEDLQQLRAQEQEHRAIHSEIRAQQEPVMIAVHNAQFLIESRHDKLSDANKGNIRSTAQELKERYEQLYTESDWRMTQLSVGLEELQKFDQENSSFEIWLTSADRTLDALLHNIAKDRDSLRHQMTKVQEFNEEIVSHAVELKFLNIFGSKFINSGEQYKNQLTDFRKKTLTKEQLRQFIEPPEANIIREKINDTNKRYEQLKMLCIEHTEKLANILSLHERWHTTTEEFTNWIEERTVATTRMVTEEIGSDVASVQEQMSKNRIVQDDVHLHLKDIQQIKSISVQLCESQPELKPTFQKTVENLSQKYDDIGTKVNDRSQQLQKAITDLTNTQDSLDSTSQWLDDFEGRLMKLDQSKVVVRLDPIMEQLQQVKMLQGELQSHRPIIEAITNKTSTMLQSSPPAMAHKLQSRINEVTARYKKYTSTLDYYTDDFQKMLAKLTGLMEKIDQLEEWMFPVMDALESRDLKKQPVQEIEVVLQEVNEEIKEHAPEYREIKKIADELINHVRAHDPSFVIDLLKNVDRNWQTMEDALGRLTDYLTTRKKLTDKYKNAVRVVSMWHDSTLAKVDQLPPLVRDLDQLKSQLEQMKPMRKEVASFKPKYDEIYEMAKTLDSLIQATETIVTNRRKSTHVALRPGDHMPVQRRVVDIQQTFQVSEDTELMHDVKVLRKLYQDLLQRITEREEVIQDLIQVITLYQEHLADLQELLDWSRPIKAKFIGEKQPITDVATLENVIAEQEALHIQLQSRRSEILEVLQNCDQFLRDNQNKLTPEQEEEMQKCLDELREYYENLIVLSLDHLKGLKTMLKKLKKEQTSKMTLERESQLATDGLVKLQDWVSEKEQVFAEQQLMEEEVNELTKQTKEHKIHYDDILSHQQPVLLCAHNTTQFLEANKERLSEDLQSKLTNGQVSLCDRYNRLTVESESRMKKHIAALDELTNLEPELDSFEKWLLEAEATMQTFLQEIGCDTETLRKQVRHLKSFNEDVFGHKGDLRILNISAQKFFKASDDYKEGIAEFRSKVLPRLSKRSSYYEPLRPSVLKDKLNELNSQYEQLTGTCSSHFNSLSDLLQLLQKYKDAVENIMGWLQSAYETLDRILKESIGVDAFFVQKQIDRLTSFHENVVSHAKDVQHVRDAGKDLSDAHPELRIDVERTIDTVQEKYNKLLGQIAERSDILNRKLIGITGMNEGLDGILNWLDMTEKKVQRLETGTVIVARKEPLLESVNEQLVLQRSLESYAPSIDTINKSTTEFLQNCEPEVAATLCKKLDTINTKYTDLKNTSHVIGDSWQTLLDGLEGFEKEVDELEDWVLPTIDILESKEFMSQELPQINQKLQDITKKQAKNQVQVDKIRKIGEEIIQQGTAKDFSYVNAVTNNMEGNWRTLDEMLDTRNAQYTELKDIKEKHEVKVDDVTKWLGTMERRFTQLPVITHDSRALQHELSVVKPLNKEIIDYKPKVDDVTSVAQNYSRLLNALEKPLTSRPRQRSLLVETARSADEPVIKKPKQSILDYSFIEEGDSDVLIEAQELNERYIALSKNFSFHIEDLEMISQYVETSTAGSDLLSWTTVTDAKLEEERPVSKDVDTLVREIATFKNLCDDIFAHNDPVSKVIHSLENFEKVYGGRLTPDLRSNLQKLITDLRKAYAELVAKARMTLAAEEQRLRNLEAEQQAMTSLDARCKQANQSMVDLLDWVTKMESALASEQPQSEKIRELDDQIQEHTAIYNDIQAHHEPLIHAVQTTGQLIEQNSQQIPGPDCANLQEIQMNLRSRYHRVSTESQNRQNKLMFADDDLKKFDEETNDFETWLSSAEEKQSKAQKLIEKEVEAVKKQIDQQRALVEDVKDQKGELKFINITGQKLITNAKEYRKDLAEFRTAAMPIDFNHTFKEAPQSTIVTSTMQNLNTRYQSLKSSSIQFNMKLSDVLDKLQNYNNKKKSVDNWLTESEGTLQKILNEPVGAEPSQVNQQIDQLKSFLDAVVLYAVEMDRLKDAGQELMAAHPDLRADTNRELDDAEDRYQKLKISLNDRLKNLQKASVDVGTVQDGLENLVKWLDDADRRVQHMDKGTVIKLRKDPLTENQQQCKVLQSDIESQRPILEAITKSAVQLTESSDPVSAGLIRSKLENVKARFIEVENTTQKHGMDLFSLTEKLKEFERVVEEVEDWELPTLTTLESKDFMASNLPDIRDQLMDATRQRDANKPKISQIHLLGEEMMQHPKSCDTSYVNSVLQNVDDNWKHLNTAIDKRSKQLDDREAATRQYDAARDDVNFWLENVERQVSQLQPVTEDCSALKMQVTQTEPLLNEVKEHQPQVAEVTKLGSVLDNLIKETEVPLTAMPHARSTRQDTEKLLKKSSQWEIEDLDSTSFFADDSPMDKSMINCEVEDINDRYNDVLDNLTSRSGQLNLMNDYLSVLGQLVETKDVLATADSQMKQKMPSSTDTEVLARELEEFKAVQSDVQQRKAIVQDVITDGEAFVKVNKTRLQPEQTQNLQSLITDLRNDSDQILVETERVCYTTQNALFSLNAQNERKSKLDEEFNSDAKALDDMLEWIQLTEEGLGSQQPMPEQSEIFIQQCDEHKALVKDIEEHNEPVQHVIQEAQHLLKSEDELEETQKQQLRSSIDQIRSRYDVIAKQANERQTRLTFGLDDLQKLEEDIKEFSEWVGDAEGQSDAAKKGISNELDTLTTQSEQHVPFADDVVTHSAHLKYMNKATQRFLSNANAYKEYLGEFRSEVLPKQTQRAFVETPESNHLRQTISSLNDRHESLKVETLNHGRHLASLIQHHQRYVDRVEESEKWLTEAESQLEELQKESISAQTEAIQQQLESVNNFRRDVATHRTDIELTKSAGQNLIEAQEEARPQVESTTDEIVKRYRALEVSSGTRYESLQTALSESQGLMANLDMLLKWLDEAEEHQHKLEKGTVVVLKTEAVMDQIDLNNILKDDITGHKAAIESVNAEAQKIMQSSPNQESSIIQEKLNKVNNRYTSLEDLSRNHGDELEHLKTELDDLERMVDQLEDKIMPNLETLESQTFMVQESNEIANRLKDLTSQESAGEADLKAIQHLGNELIKNPKSNDASYVTSVLNNVEENWRSYESMLNLRKKQLSLLNQAEERYHTGNQDTAIWLTTMERKLSQLQPVSLDLRTLDRQEKELEPFKAQVDDYEPDIADLETAGHSLDHLRTEFKTPVPTKPHHRSTYTAGGYMPSDRRASVYSESILNLRDGIEDSPVQHQLRDTRRRYNTLKFKISERETDIDLTRQFLEKFTLLNHRLDWCTAVERNLRKKKPTSKDLETLKSEFDLFKDVHTDINSNKSVVLETIVAGDQFLHDNRNKLTEEETEELEEKISELRMSFDDISRNADEIYKDTETEILRLERIHTEVISLRVKYEEATTTTVKLLDKVTELEFQLGQEQPQEEVLPALKQQADHHKIIHEDIEACQQPILQTIHNVSQLVRQYGTQMKDQDAYRLKCIADDLKSRYNTVVVQSHTRLNRLNQAVSDLEHGEQDIAAFTHWLSSAEVKMDQVQCDVANNFQDLEKNLENQKVFAEEIVTYAAHLKYRTLSGYKFVENAKVYREELSDFRTSVLPKEFNKNFQENPEPEVIMTTVGDLNDRYSQLKLTSNDYMKYLSELVEKHRHFNTLVESTYRWLGDISTDLDRLLKEPIGSDPNMIQRQINRLKVLLDAVILHGKDINAVKEAGQVLIEAQHSTTAYVDQTTYDIVKKYNELEGQIDNRQKALKSSLSDMQSLQERLDGLFQWLDDKERTVFRLQQGTVIVIKKMPLVERLQEYRLLEKDINSHQPVIDSVMQAISKLMTNCSPEERQLFQSKIENFNTRFAATKTNLKQHGETLQNLSGKLVDLERDVDKLEEWLMPVLDELEGPDIMKKDISELEQELQAISNDVSNHLQEHQDIHALGHELMEHPRASDSSFVTAVLSNLNQNWTCLQDILTKRFGQMDDRKLAKKRYSSLVEKVNFWLKNTEQSLEGINPSTRDVHSVEIQIQKLTPLKKEIQDYKPKINEVNKLGTTVDSLQREQQARISSRRRYWSTQIGATLQTEWTPPQERDISRTERSILEEDTDVEKELFVINKRYNELDRVIIGLLDELRVMHLWLDKKDAVEKMTDQVKEMNGNLYEKKPVSRELIPLTREMESFTAVNSDFLASKPSILEAIHGTEQFLRDNHDSFTPLIQKELQDKVNDLRAEFEALCTNSDEWQRESQRFLEHLNVQEEEQVALSDRYTSICQGLQNMLDWVNTAENALATEQPLAETTADVPQQLKEHKIIHEDIQAHQTPVVQATQDSQQLLRQHAQHLNEDERRKLSEYQTDLRYRFDAANTESHNRLNKLKFAEEDVSKLEEEVKDFEKWLDSAEASLDASMEGISKDLSSNRSHYGQQKGFNEDVIAHSADLKYIVKAGQKILDGAKGYKQDLAAYREVVPRQVVRNFTENPPSNVIRSKLNQITARYERLKLSSKDHCGELEEVVSRQQSFEDQCDQLQSWFQDTENTAKAIMHEPIGADPVVVQKQIDKLKTLRTAVSGQLKDIDKTKETAHELGAIQPELVQAANASTEQLLSRYNVLDNQIKERDAVLHTKLAESQNVQDGLDDLLDWIDGAEKDSHRIEKGTIIVTKRDPLFATIQEHKAVEETIMSQLPRIESVKCQAAKLIETSEPKVARTIQSKVDALSARYGKLTIATDNYKHILQEISDNLEVFEKEVETLEDWLIPVLDRLQSKDIGKLDLPSLEKELKEIKKQMGENRLRLKRVHSIGDGMVRDSKAVDTSYITTVMRNVDLNWRSLDELLAKRFKQFDSKARANKRYQQYHRDVTHWLDTMEHKVDSLLPVAEDIVTVQTQMDQVKPLKSEVSAYKQKVTDLNKLGQIFDKLMHEEESPVHSRPHYRSLQVGSAGDGALLPPKPADVEETTFTSEEEESVIQTELSSAKKRYDTLVNRLNDRDDELAMTKAFLEKSNQVGGLVEWVTQVDSKLVQSAPKSEELGQLNVEYEVYRGILSDVSANKPCILEAIHTTEQFLADKRNQITPQQAQQLEHQVSDLRSQYDNVTQKSDVVYRQSETKLDQLKQVVEEKTKSKEQYKSAIQSLQSINDWLTKAEHDLGSEQPLSQQGRQLTDQLNQHKVLHKDVLAHQAPVLEVMQQLQQVLKLPQDKLEDIERQTLQEGLEDLKARYETVHSNSHARLSRLQYATEDIQKFEPEVEHFEEWLKEAEQKLEESTRNVETDARGLRKQYSLQKAFTDDVITHAADLKYLNMSGQKFINSSKNYKEDLAEFRGKVLPRQFTKTFSEVSQPNVIHDKLTSVNTQYDRLKTRCFDHSKKLQDVTEKQQKYFSTSEPLTPWLDETANNLQQLLDEPVAAEPITVQHQLGKLKTVADDILIHGKEVERLKEASREFCEVHDGVKKDVAYQTREKVDKYSELEAKIMERSNLLQSALADSNNVQEGLNNLVRQIQDAEYAQSRLEQAPVMMRKEALLETVKQYGHLENRLESLRPNIEKVNQAAASLIQTSDPSVVMNIQNKLDDMNARFGKVLKPIKEQSATLQTVTDQLCRLQRETDEVEDWLLPTLDILESKELNQKDLAEMGSVLQEIESSRAQFEPEYEEVHQVADEMLREAKTSDVNNITALVQNLDQNWAKLDDLLSFRKKQLDERTRLREEYNSLLSEVNTWLTGMERKKGQLGPIPTDVESIQKQLEEVKPFKQEVVEYKPNIIKVNDLGKALDNLIQDAPEAISRFHRKSTEVITSTPIAQPVMSRLRGQEDLNVSGLLEEKTEIQRQVDDVNKRFKDLDVELDDREDELELVLETTKKLTPMESVIEWITATEDTLSTNLQATPQSLTELQHELETLVAVESEIVCQQTPVQEASVGADHLIQERGRNLRPEQHEVLQNRHTVMKNRFSKLAGDIVERKKAIEDTIQKKQMEEQEKSSLDQKMSDVMNEIQSFSDWLSQTEQKLGSAQPMNEQVKSVSVQLDRHKALHQDVIDHQPIMSQSQQEVVLLLRQHGHKLSPEDEAQLKFTSDDLKRRYDAVSGQSLSRVNKLKSALEDLQQYKEEFKEFEDWLQEQEQKVDNLQKDVGRDQTTLTDQIEEMKEIMEDVSDHKGDLKFIKRAGHKYLDSAKEFRSGLGEFRKSAMPASFNKSFLETPESNIIRDELADSYERYMSLKNRSRAHYKVQKDLVGKHQKYKGACDVVLPWLELAYEKVSKEVAEPIAAEPENVTTQMDSQKALHDDCVLHTKDIEKLRDYGKDLSDAQGQVKDQVEETIRDVTEKYNWMESQLADRSNKLRTAIVVANSVHDNIDQLLRWVDSTEKSVTKLSESPVVVKKEALLERIQDLKLLQTDIESNKPAIDSLHESAMALIKTSDPQLAQNIKGKLDILSTRYVKVSNIAKNHNEYLHKMLAKLDQLQAEVDKLEDWLIPMIERLESRDFNRMELLELGMKLMEIQREIDENRYTFQDIKRLGSDITRDPKTSDTSRITDMMANLSKNWETLEALMQKRNTQLQESQEAHDKFSEIAKATCDWLENMEDKVDALPPIAIDIETLKQQQHQHEPLIQEYDGFTSKIDEVNSQGVALENLTQDSEPSSTKSSPFRRSRWYLQARSDTRSVESRSHTSRRSSFGSELDQSSFLMDEITKTHAMGVVGLFADGSTQCSFMSKLVTKTHSVGVVALFTDGSTQCS
ncbi:microtubule-actin cross-linking factor 1-like [Anneissia japonica]|uniref:microtubule-actin cross-linking factor 1-like n=1 Tax=Anneissia japonica TaxID=1529436 RepID=UPI001425A99F|nr:microtubule-actin cross-linking factor 1-like [Anneissia japonica]